MDYGHQDALVHAIVAKQTGGVCKDELFTSGVRGKKAICGGGRRGYAVPPWKGGGGVAPPQAPSVQTGQHQPRLSRISNPPSSNVYPGPYHKRQDHIASLADHLFS